jgi:uncharacterized RDD family membrane protein YckC
MYTTYAPEIRPTLSAMSDSGTTPPPDPSGQPNPYGGQPPPYGAPQQPYTQQPPYGQPYTQQPPYGQPYGAVPQVPVYDYAHWIKRVGGYLLDSLFTTLTAIPAYALLFAGINIGTQNLETHTDANGVSRTTGDWDSGGTALVIIGSVLFLLPLLFFIWNTCLRQGRTGYSLGKGIVGIRLIGEASGQPIGGGLSFVRYLCHIVDSLPCYLGWFWPLWDTKRQTFSDKIMSTVVINQAK